MNIRTVDLGNFGTISVDSFRNVIFPHLVRENLYSAVQLAMSSREIYEIVKEQIVECRVLLLTLSIQYVQPDMWTKFSRLRSLLSKNPSRMFAVHEVVTSSNNRVKSSALRVVASNNDLYLLSIMINLAHMDQTLYTLINQLDECDTKELDADNEYIYEEYMKYIKFQKSRNAEQENIDDTAFDNHEHALDLLRTGIGTAQRKFRRFINDVRLNKFSGWSQDEAYDDFSLPTNYEAIYEDDTDITSDVSNLDDVGQRYNIKSACIFRPDNAVAKVTAFSPDDISVVENDLKLWTDLIQVRYKQYSALVDSAIDKCAMQMSIVTSKRREKSEKYSKVINFHERDTSTVSPSQMAMSVFGRNRPKDHNEPCYDKRSNPIFIKK